MSDRLQAAAVLAPSEGDPGAACADRAQRRGPSSLCSQTSRWPLGSEPCQGQGHKRSEGPPSLGLQRRPPGGLWSPAAIPKSPPRLPPEPLGPSRESGRVSPALAHPPITPDPCHLWLPQVSGPTWPPPWDVNESLPRVGQDAGPTRPHPCCTGPHILWLDLPEGSAAAPGPPACCPSRQVQSERLENTTKLYGAGPAAVTSAWLSWALLSRDRFGWGSHEVGVGASLGSEAPEGPIPPPPTDGGWL